jgi:hypothetical protein
VVSTAARTTSWPRVDLGLLELELGLDPRAALDGTVLRVTVLR